MKVGMLQEDQNTMKRTVICSASLCTFPFSPTFRSLPVHNLSSGFFRRKTETKLRVRETRQRIDNLLKVSWKEIDASLLTRKSKAFALHQARLVKSNSKESFWNWKTKSQLEHNLSNLLPDQHAHQAVYTESFKLLGLSSEFIIILRMSFPWTSAWSRLSYLHHSQSNGMIIVEHL